MLVVVGAALAGGGAAGEAIPAASPGEPLRPSSAATGAVLAPAADGESSDIVLDSPGAINQLITGRVVLVRGHLHEGTGRVQVLLQSNGAEPIVVRTVEPIILPDRRGRVLPPQFVVTLAVPDPRPSGPAVVQIVAYDGSGRARDVLLHPIQIGALLDPTYSDGSRRPPTGEDGLMGGITFGTNVTWLEDGR